MSRHSSHRFAPHLIAYGYRPTNRHRQLLHHLRQEEALNGIRILAEPGVSLTDLGSLIRTASLAGCNSFYQLTNEEHGDEPITIFDPMVIRGSAGMIFTMPVYEHGTLRHST